MPKSKRKMSRESFQTTSREMIEGIVEESEAEDGDIGLSTHTDKGASHDSYVTENQMQEMLEHLQASLLITMKRQFANRQHVRSDKRLSTNSNENTSSKDEQSSKRSSSASIRGLQRVCSTLSLGMTVKVMCKGCWTSLIRLKATLN